MGDQLDVDLAAVSRSAVETLECLERSQPEKWRRVICEFVEDLRVMNISTHSTAAILAMLANGVHGMVQKGRRRGDGGNRSWLAMFRRGATVLRDNHSVVDQFKRELFWALEGGAGDYIERIGDFGLGRMYVDRHLEDTVSVKRLAEDLGWSVRRLDTAFKKHLGMSVSVYRRRERVRRAAKLIATGWKIEAAMLSVGYRNKTHFNRLFRKQYTCGPSEYRID